MGEWVEDQNILEESKTTFLRTKRRLMDICVETELALQSVMHVGHCHLFGEGIF